MANVCTANVARFALFSSTVAFSVQKGLVTFFVGNAQALLGMISSYGGLDLKIHTHQYTVAGFATRSAIAEP